MICMRRWLTSIIFRETSATDRFKAKGQPFKAETPSNSHILVSKPEHIEELSQASHKHLSLHAVAKEVMISSTPVMSHVKQEAAAPAEIYHAWL